ncbi:MAG: type II toxin-antitoxin system VapC family toxin, partial [Gammaproteobacteria bacterium]
GPAGRAMSFLVDTNVLSELRKGDRADPNVTAWFSGLADDEVFLSALTVGDLRRGVERIRLRDRPTAAILESWLDRVTSQHEERILAVDREIAEEWGRLSVPDPLPVIDGLLAATAKVRGLTLATRNVRDGARTGVPVIDPFVRVLS